MMHLHEQNVLHHDRKPENILIDSNEKHFSKSYDLDNKKLNDKIFPINQKVK